MATAPIPLTPSPYIEFIRSLEQLPPGTPDSETLDILAWTMLGEAANQGDEGLQAIANVIQNRANSGEYPADLKRVALQSKQFSTWNKGQGGNNPKARYPKSSDAFQKARTIAADVVSGRRPDITGGATHYWSPKGMKAMGYAETPYWAESEKSRWGTLKLGDHVFLPKKPVPPNDIPNSAAPRPLEKPNRIRLAQAMTEVLADTPRPLPAPRPLNPNNPLEQQRTTLNQPTKVRTVAIDPTTGFPPKAQEVASLPAPAPLEFPPLRKPPVEGLIKVVPGRNLSDQTWTKGGAGQAGTVRMADARPSVVSDMYEKMGIEDPLGQELRLDRFNSADVLEELDFDKLKREYRVNLRGSPPVFPGMAKRQQMQAPVPLPRPRPTAPVPLQRPRNPVGIMVSGGQQRPVAQPTTGSTFAERAAAAARREALMNPPTETNWAAIEASARNRR